MERRPGMKDKDLTTADKQEGDSNKDIYIDTYVAPAITKHKNLMEITKELDDTFSFSW
jgi:hypothetical protein